MRFLSIYKTAERGVPPSQEEMTRMGKLIEEGMKAGYLLGVEGCLPSVKGARVRLSNGAVTVTDGPFTESKELVGGFAILKADSKEEAIRLAKDFLNVAEMASANCASYTNLRRRLLSHGCAARTPGIGPPAAGCVKMKSYTPGLSNNFAVRSVIRPSRYRVEAFCAGPVTGLSRPRRGT